MNRTTAIVITVGTTLLCGCPGLALAALGVMAAMGSQMPEVLAQNPPTQPSTKQYRLPRNGNRLPYALSQRYNGAHSNIYIGAKDAT